MNLERGAIVSNVFRARTFVVGLGLVAVSAVGCGAGAFPPPLAPCPTTHAAKVNESFLLDKAALSARGASTDVLNRLESSPHRYFRALEPRYSARTCAAFADVRSKLPTVAIHGDAHVEQFVVTDTTFGLEDFDQSGYGPAVVDLVRYAASLHLTCHEVPFTCDADKLVATYFDAYRSALARAPSRNVPSLVARIRRNTSRDRNEWLAWVDKRMTHVTPSEDALVRSKWAQMVANQNDPRMRPPYSDVVKVGGLRMGIGSGLDVKVLLRLRGPSDAPDDDVVIEGRSTPEPAEDPCVWRPREGRALYTLMFMSLLGPRTPEFVGVAPFESAPEASAYWVQSWDFSYRELAIADLASERELDELAEDAGKQLGGSGWAHVPEPFRTQQRLAQLAAFDLVDARAKKLARELADETRKVWETYRVQGAR